MQRGRPRTFDKTTALEAALAVFWRNGYHATSLAQLTRATGLAKPSLYAAFGNKEQLYLAALQRYREQQLDRHAEALYSDPDPVNALRLFLRSVATMLTAEELPGGCMVVNTATGCDVGALPSGIVAAIDATVNQSTFELLKTRLREAFKQRPLPAHLSVEQLADFFTAIMSGMAVMAKIGVSKSRLYDTIEQALRVLPDSAA